MGFCEHGYETVRSKKQRISGLAEQTWSSYGAARHVKLIRLFRSSVCQHKLKLWRLQSVPFLQPPPLQRCTSLCLFVLPQT